MSFEKNPNIVTRFAPSPTGAAHAGSYRSAMFAWLFARHNGGKFILRIEDTDTARNQEGSDTQIIESLAWLGISYDDIYYQSKNLGRHREIIETLITSDHAYVSTEPAKDGSGMKDLIRFRNPNKSVTVHDVIRGEVTVDTTDLGDFIIARTIDEPIFHLANVIDDHDEGVTYVVRAEEHLANTPRQILIFEALGWEIPMYAHLPLVLGPDKLKLSKRRNALAMLEYRDRGYLPEAVFNCVALVGWNPGTEQEIFSKHELIEQFDLSRVQKSGAVFSEEKLNWFNREYIKRLGFDDQLMHVKKFLPEKFQTISAELLVKLIPIIVERIDCFGDVAKMAADGELDYYLDTPIIDTTKLSWKGEDLSLAKKHLEQVISKIQNIPESKWNGPSIKESIWDYAEATGRGNVLWPMRFALSGRDKSPDPFILSEILGKTETIIRLEKACAII